MARNGKATALDNFRRGWDIYKMNTLQRDLAKSYQSQERVSEHIEIAYTILSNNGYSYKRRIQKLKEEIEDHELTSDERKYISEALGVVYQRMTARKKGKFDRTIKNRVETSREILKLQKDLDTSIGYDRLDERYFEIQKDARIISHPKRPLARIAGSALIKGLAYVAGSIIIAGTSAFAGWSIGSNSVEKKLLPELKQKTVAVKQLEEKVSDNAEEIKNLEKKVIDVKTENLKLQERNLELTHKITTGGGEVSKKSEAPKARFADAHGRVRMEFPFQMISDDGSTGVEVKQFGDIRVKLIPAEKAPKEVAPPTTVVPLTPQEVKPSSQERQVIIPPQVIIKPAQESPRIPDTTNQQTVLPERTLEATPPQGPIIIRPENAQVANNSEVDILDKEFNAYGKHLGRKGREQWRQGKPVESIITGAGSWISLAGEIARKGVEPAAELTGGAIGVITSSSKEHNRAGWRKGIQVGENATRFVWRNTIGGPNWNNEIANASEIVSIKRLEFNNEGDPFVKDDGIPGFAVRVGSNILLGSAIENNIGGGGSNGGGGSSGGGGVSGGTGSSPGGIPR